jgi:hypothetical protein
MNGCVGSCVLARLVFREKGLLKYKKYLVLGLTQKVGGLCVYIILTIFSYRCTRVG